MPTFTFQGFTEGSLVALSAGQGTQGASGSVPEWGLSNMNTATIDFSQITQAEIVAPAGVWFEATGYSGFDVSENLTTRQTYDPSAHEIFHLWDFNDPGQFETPLNIPTAWNNKNADYGKKAYHVFDTPGLYAVRLWAIDATGNIGSALRGITVLDPDTVYSGNRTICVSNQNDWTGAPSGAQQVTSFAAARSALAALGQSGRILLRRGETFTENFNIDNDLDDFQIGAFGTGAKPVLTPPYGTTGNAFQIISSSRSAGLPDFAIWGLRFEGEWDAATETGDPRGIAFNADGWNETSDGHWFLYQCEVDGMGTAVFPAPNNAAHVSALVDCDITNWQDYGVGQFNQNYIADKRLAIVGCSIHQKQNACTNTLGKFGLANDHGPVRIVSESDMVISASDFYSANTWFNNGLLQPCLRLYTGRDNPGGFFVNVNRIACEGGLEQISLDGESDGVTENPGNHLFDMVLCVGDYVSSAAMRLHYGGTTVRNTIVVNPGLPRPPATVGLNSAFNISANSPSAANTASVMRLTHNTVLNLMDGGDDLPFVNGSSNFTGFVAQDNIIHEPNLVSPNTPDAPLDTGTAIAGFTPRNRGRRLSLNKPSASVNLANGNSFTIPYPTNTAGVPTGPADFSPGGRHTVKIDNSYYFSYRGDCTLSFGASSITITNTSGSTWSGTAQVALDQDTLATDDTYESPATVPLPVPQTGSQALTNDDSQQAYTQFDTAARTRPRGAV